MNRLRAAWLAFREPGRITRPVLSRLPAGHTLYMLHRASALHLHERRYIVYEPGAIASDGSVEAVESVDIEHVVFTVDDIRIGDIWAPPWSVQYDFSNLSWGDHRIAATVHFFGSRGPERVDCRVFGGPPVEVSEVERLRHLLAQHGINPFPQEAS